MFSTYKLDAFGKKLKNIRTNNRLTQKNVKEKTGINEDTIRRIENGQVIPKYETLEILSYVYKTDLIGLLKNYRINHSISTYYSEIDKMIVSNESDAIKSLAHQLNKTIIRDHKKYNLINNEELKLLQAFIQATIDYNDPEYENRITIADGLIEALTQSINDFDIKKFDASNYNLLEIRLLMFIGLVNAKARHLETSNKIFEFCLDYLIDNTNNDKETMKIVIKLYFNLSYNHHILDDNLNAYEYSTKGIEYTLSNDLIYCLPQLFARKGIAEYKLNRPENMTSLSNSIRLFRMMGSDKLAELYKKILKDMYNIVINE